MKLSTWCALLLAIVVAGIILAHVITRQPLSDGVVYLSGGLLVFAAFMWDSARVDGWIRAVIDHLPSFGRKQE